MPLAIGLALAALCLGAVAFPFLRKSNNAPPEYGDPILEMEQRRQAIYREAGALHNDYVLGDVPLADYQERLQEYRLQAAHLLYQQEHLRELDRGLEAEILSHRKVAEPQGVTPRCPECRSPTSSAMNYCPSCGAMLSGAVKDG